MKNINHQDVILDIEKRMKFFDENRIKKVPTNLVESNKEIKKVDFVDNKNHLTVVKEDLILNNVFDRELFFEKKEKFEAPINREVLIIEDVFEKEMVFEKRAKLEGFTKKDDFFLKEDDEDLINQKKEEKKESRKGFFQTISNFFDGKSLNKDLEETIPKTVEALQLEKVESKSQKDIETEDKIKAEKLRLIEEEYKLKAEKRESEEKFLQENQEDEVLKSNADFRKNKRKK